MGTGRFGSFVTTVASPGHWKALFCLPFLGLGAKVVTMAIRGRVSKDGLSLLPISLARACSTLFYVSSADPPSPWFLSLQHEGPWVHFGTQGGKGGWPKHHLHGPSLC